MRLIKVIPHGPLAQNYHPCEIGGDTVGDVLEGWSRQVGMDDIPIDDRPLLQVVGFDSEDKLKAKTDVTEIHIVPAMFGGGGGFGKILFGAAIIGLSFLPFIGQAVQAAMIVSGATTALMGAVELFLGAPSLSKEEDPEASKYLGTGKNTTAIGTPIGIGGGRMKIGGHILSLQVNSSDLVYGSFPASPS